MARTAEKYTKAFFLSIVSNVQSSVEAYDKVESALAETKEGMVSHVMLSELQKERLENVNKASRKLAITISNVLLGEIDNVEIPFETVLKVAAMISQFVPDGEVVK